MVLIAFDFIPRSMRESNQPRSLGVGDILECGGKQSATPFCLAQLRGNRESLGKKRLRRFALPAQSKMLA
jgi:hypothetical protein